MEEEIKCQDTSSLGDRKKRGRWKCVARYLRELSVIIVGILITVGITSLVNNRSRQKELRGMLTLVKAELKENTRTLERTWKNYEGEQHIFRILQDSRYDIESIPADTLDKYRYAIGALHSLDQKSDSYEVLKGSVLTQYVKEKGLMADLSATYRMLDDLNRQLMQYSDRKSEYFYPLIDKLGPQEIEIWMHGTVHDWFRYPVLERSFRTFLITGPTIISSGTFGYCAQTLKETIAGLERYGY